MFHSELHVLTNSTELSWQGYDGVVGNAERRQRVELFIYCGKRSKQKGNCNWVALKNSELDMSDVQIFISGMMSQPSLQETSLMLNKNRHAVLADDT